MNEKTVWETYTEEEKEKVFDFCEEYRTFLSKCKTERECVEEILKDVEAHGYRSLKSIRKEGKSLKAGDKVYVSIMGKTLALFHIGRKSMEEGMNILGAHIDSPRLDLKQNPLYEDGGQAMLETHYYGGIKKYQWVAMPLALHGVVAKKDDSVVKITLGEDALDPVVGISDLLPHLGKKQMEKKGSEVIEGEDLNILIGSIPLAGEEKEPVKKQILQLLKDKYNIEETDFISAELEAVPAGPARNYGLDESMLIGYGQDDRVCAYPSYKAMLELTDTEYTCVCLLVDKEEIGSVGATGMHSRFFENAVAEIMDAAGDYSELKVRRALQNSRMLSSDVSAAYDPNYPSVMERKNSAFFGKGLTFNKFTGSRGKSGSNDANAEYIARIRKVLDENNAAFQTAELGRVDEGGGGTIAYILANYGMEVIDCGVAVQNMHAPYEVTSKADVYEAFKGYQAFLKNMGGRKLI
ncbi:MAG: aminopeptidase [Firmicutes bacterium]|nr:aminopeptidase [Lachnospiraceae bacterium]MDD6066533.1 aminopeptidase [Bacillota bacterium]